MSIEWNIIGIWCEEESGWVIVEGCGERIDRLGSLDSTKPIQDAVNPNDGCINLFKIRYREKNNQSMG